MATAASKHTKMALVSVNGASQECVKSRLLRLLTYPKRASFLLVFSGSTFKSRGSACTHSASIAMTRPSASASSRPCFVGASMAYCWARSPLDDGALMG